MFHPVILFFYFQSMYVVLVQLENNGEEFYAVPAGFFCFGVNENFDLEDQVRFSFNFYFLRTQFISMS